MNAKCQAAAGPARPKPGPSPGPRAGPGRRPLVILYLGYIWICVLYIWLLFLIVFLNVFGIFDKDAKDPQKARVFLWMVPRCKPATCKWLFFVHGWD